MRDRLIELLEQAEGLKNNDMPSLEEIVDYLLANGVIVPPCWCNIGDYIFWHNPIKTGVDLVREEIIAYGYNGFFHQADTCPLYFTPFSEIGKTVFLSK